MRAAMGLLVVATLITVFVASSPELEPTPEPQTALETEWANSSEPSPTASSVLYAGEADAALSLDRALDFLWSKQHADGSWRSETYAFLKHGAAFTPFVLWSILETAPADSESDRSAFAEGQENQQKINRALAFIRSSVATDGAVGAANADDPNAPAMPEYPVYATSYALRCLVTANDPADADRIQRMRGYLIRMQRQAANGSLKSDPVHGGWGFGSPAGTNLPGHIDLSYTRHALEALAMSGGIPAETAKRAERFLSFVQRRVTDLRPQPPKNLKTAEAQRHAAFDGGFYLSPNVLDANKGGIASVEGYEHYRSYATTTCDGLLAMLALGHESNGAHVAAALRWLETHASWITPAGIPENDHQRWRDGVHFYHIAVRAEVATALSRRDTANESRRDTTATQWRSAAKHLTSQQLPDGSFANRRNHLVKEDDPLIATVFAITLLGTQPATR